MFFHPQQTNPPTKNPRVNWSTAFPPIPTAATSRSSESGRWHSDSDGWTVEVMYPPFEPGQEEMVVSGSLKKRLPIGWGEPICYLPFFWGGNHGNSMEGDVQNLQDPFFWQADFGRFREWCVFIQVTLEDNFIMSHVIDSMICDMICCEVGKVTNIFAKLRCLMVIYHGWI